MDRERDDHISLNPHQAEYVQHQLDDGRFRSKSDMVNEALRQMEEGEDFHPAEFGLSPEQFRQEIEEAWKEIERGELLDGEQVMRELDERHEQEREARKRKRA